MVTSDHFLHFAVIPEQSAILLEITTSLGPVNFGALGLEGFVGLALRDGVPDLSTAPTAHLDVQVDQLTSGNAAYDGELRRHINSRRFPTAYADLLDISLLETTPPTYRVEGEITFSGQTASVEGHVEAAITGDMLVVSGRVTLDMLWFGIPPPSLFMMQIDPEVQVSMQLEASATKD